MKILPPKSVDLILCDLPYGTTCLEWDSVIDFKALWAEYDRIIKDDGVICLFSAQPFTSALIMSNLSLYRYSWIWDKQGATGFLNCSTRPLKSTEDICVFSKATVGSLSKNPMRYYPQGLIRVKARKRNNPNSTFRKSQGYNGHNQLNTDTEFVQEFTNYPTEILRFKRELKPVHPTQKPVDLLKYLIRTYTREGEVVLDNCMGSGSTGVACVQTNRRFIGMEITEEYFSIAKQRITSAKQEKDGFRFLETEELW